MLSIHNESSTLIKHEMYTKKSHFGVNFPIMLEPPSKGKFAEIVKNSVAIDQRPRLRISSFVGQVLFPLAKARKCVDETLNSPVATIVVASKGNA